jgi:hypothetical protein
MQPLTLNPHCSHVLRRHVGNTNSNLLGFWRNRPSVKGFTLRGKRANVLRSNEKQNPISPEKQPNQRAGFN